MGQIVDVPGVGPVEFPDDMNDDQIVAAIRKNSMFPKPPKEKAGFFSSKMTDEQRAQVEDMKKRGWGTGVPKFAYELGGKTTDFMTNMGASPEVAAGAGYAANVLTQAIPSFLTSARSMEAPVEPILAGPSKWIMQTAVKPSKAARESGDGVRAIKDMLDDNIYPTASGMEKAAKVASKMDKKVEAALAKSGATVPVSGITARLGDPLARAEKQFVPQSDVSAIEDVWTKALQNPLIAGKKEIPVQLAHELKKGTYRSLGGKAYGEVGSTSVEAQKALARGAKEEIAAAVPGVAKPLEKQASMMNVMDVAADRALLEASKNPLALAALRLDHPLSAMGFMADRSAALKAFLAMQMYGGTRPELLSPLAMSLGMRQAQEEPLPPLLKQLGALYP